MASILPVAKASLRGQSPANAGVGTWRRCSKGRDRIDGLPVHYYSRPEIVLDPVARIEQADRFFRNIGAVIPHGANQAFYAAGPDLIQMPPFEAFKDAASYYATLSQKRPTGLRMKTAPAATCHAMLG